MVSWAQPSQSPKWHLDWFSHRVMAWVCTRFNMDSVLIETERQATFKYPCVRIWQWDTVNDGRTRKQEAQLLSIWLFAVMLNITANNPNLRFIYDFTSAVHEQTPIYSNRWSLACNINLQMAVFTVGTHCICLHIERCNMVIMAASKQCICQSYGFH